MSCIERLIAVLHVRERNTSFVPVDDEQDKTKTCPQPEGSAARRRYVLRGGRVAEVSGAPDRETR